MNTLSSSRFPEVSIRCFAVAAPYADKSRGFAAKVGEKVIDSVSALGKDYQVLVEEDQEIQQMNGGSVGL